MIRANKSKRESMNKVVITGIGVVSPIGSNADEFTRSLKQGIVGRRSLHEANPERFKEFDADEIAFPLSGFKPPPYAKILDPNIQYSMAATEEALSDSRLDLSWVDHERIGIAVSSSKGGMYTFEHYNERMQNRPSALVAARVYANLLPNIATQWIARHWELRGPAKVAVAACATGLFAIIEGIRMIEQGEADCCIAGAGDASLTRLMLAGYRQMGVLSKNKMIRPYDLRRDGFLIGEGAGILILESEVYAKARKANCYGKVRAHVYGFEPSHPISFDERSNGLERCLQELLKRGGIKPREIDYLNLHGTGTQSGDRYETAQIKKAFGQDAYQIPASSTKSMTGHMVGASGAVEVITSLIAMRDGFIPPTANLEIPDPVCDLDCTPLRSKDKKINLACSISLGFGGQLAAILLEK
ncbi:MAG: hypothetical protein A3J12_10355 [Omnitrophica bacterium RIFCSPLOWO2_02_FULL_44_11]|nr:MAG: hypothetical protein A3J12_10355 [Omnitrophica bacterium RIFCSPLOWO2_02_FULL_44_11]